MEVSESKMLVATWASKTSHVGGERLANKKRSACTRFECATASAPMASMV